jgi:hypothetical protein
MGRRTVRSRTGEAHGTWLTDSSRWRARKFGRQPFPAWKRIDVLAETLSAQDKSRVARAGGTIAVDAYRGEESPDASSSLD